MELNEKMLEKAKDAKTADELIALAKENGVELTAEEAKTYFAKLNAKEGELTDDELDNVSGGGKCGTIYYENRPLVSGFNSCDLFIHEKTYESTPGGYCKDCYYSQDTGGALLCMHGERYDN